MSPRYDAGRIRGRLLSFHVQDFYRLIRAEHEKHPLDAVPRSSRFSDPRSRYAVLYAAAAVRCSFWESIARSRFTHRQRREIALSTIHAMRIVMLCSTEPLLLLDLRGDGPIRIAAPTAVAHDTNHAAGRALSGTVYASVPEADGIVFESRFTGDVCVAVFDRAIDKLKAVSVEPLVTTADFLDSLVDYEIELIAEDD